MAWIAASTSSASFWETVEYISMGGVTLGVIGEFVVEFTELIASAIWRERVKKGSPLVLIFALGIELIAAITANNINNLTIADLRHDTARLNSRLAPRSISPDQAASLRFALFALGHQEIDICVYPNDRESLQIADEIAGAMSNANWAVNGYKQVDGPRVVSGMLVEFDPKADSGTKEAATGLVSALHNTGLDVAAAAPLSNLSNATQSMGAPMYKLRLTVGLK